MYLVCEQCGSSDLCRSCSDAFNMLAFDDQDIKTGVESISTPKINIASGEDAYCDAPFGAVPA